MTPRREWSFPRPSKSSESNLTETPAKSVNSPAWSAGEEKISLKNSKKRERSSLRNSGRPSRRKLQREQSKWPIQSKARSTTSSSNSASETRTDNSQSYTQPNSNRTVGNAKGITTLTFVLIHWQHQMVHR